MDFEKIKDILFQRGIAQTGFARVAGLVPKPYADYSYAVSLVYKLSSGLLDEVQEGPTFSYFHHYRTVNAFLDSQTLWLCTMIEREGFRAVPVAASQSRPGADSAYDSLFQHKTAAVLAGLGWIGKSALFVSPEFGPRVRLGTVLTDMPLPAEKPRMPVGCGECNICVQACPAMAIKGKNYFDGCSRADLFDAQACSQHMKRAYQHIGRGAVCGICVSRCPFGKKR